MRTVLGFLEYFEKHNKKQATLIVLYIERKHDNFYQFFMFKFLEEINFDENFINKIDLNLTINKNNCQWRIN